MKISQGHDNDLTVLRVSGDLDLLTSPELGARLDGIVRDGTGDVVVDLSRTGFIDSAALHVLLNAQRRLTRESRSLAVVCVPGPVRRLIELTRMVETLGVVASVSEHRRRSVWRRSAGRDVAGPPELEASGSASAIALPAGTRASEDQ
jgi:anti-sigma B factor antagonist